VLVDVQLPIIGVEVTNFHLLVDCCNNRFLDGITSLSTPAQAASVQFPSVKSIDSTTPVDKLFTEFPDFTRPREPHGWCATTRSTT
jgi:hypothetical protein